MKRRIRFALAVLAFSAMTSSAQTNKKNMSSVGTWEVDVAHSDFGSEPSPKSVTLTILKDTPQMLSWRVRGVDDKGMPFAYSWNGPEDGSMLPVKLQGAGDAGMQSAKREADGSLLRHGEDKEGSSFDARDTLSDDGNMINEVVTAKSKDGKEEKTTSVMRRVRGETSGAKS